MIYIILGTGFEEIEATAPCDILRRGNADVKYAAVGRERTVIGAHGIGILADCLVSEIEPGKGDRIVIPGGMGGVNSIKGSNETMEMIAAAAKRGADVSAICAGPSVLAKLGLLDGKQITCYPGCEDMMTGASCDSSKAARKDGSVITGRSPGAAVEFGLALLEDAKGAGAAAEVRRGLAI